MGPSRVLDLTGKAWKYALAALEQPARIPNLLMNVSQGAHLGELLNLRRQWIRSAGIQTVIDVGAHAGEFSSAVRATLPDAQVYAFEPIPDCYSRMVKRLGSTRQFKAFPVAIGDTTGPVSFHRSSFTKSSSVLPMAPLHQDAFPWSAGAVTMSVSMKRLDEFLGEIELRSKVLLKLDVQGYELRALKGATTVLARVDYIVTEVSFRPLYEGQALFPEVFSFLSAQGFTFAGLLDQLPSPIDDTLLQADAIFVRQS
jgi:FkbM family methyltransferase